jgi:hypothetical protein
MTKKEFIKKLKLTAEKLNVPSAEWKEFDPLGEDKKLTSYNKGYIEGFIRCQSEFDYLLAFFESHRIN